MAYKKAPEMFGDGGGFGPAVPYSTVNPPGTSAGNRGIQFGEQLTAAIANRTHYALAQNTDDLNTRLATFEAGGLNAAYDNGAVGPAGGGREITKDGGAVETISALATQYADDVANAHFRANSIADAVRGSVGFDFAGFGRSPTAPLAGFLDRRAMNFAGVSVISDGIAATLATNVITIGVGQFKDGGNDSHLLLGYDFVEILGGVDSGLYVLTSLPSGTSCTVVRLDGSTPAFTAAAVTVRVFRAQFGSFNIHGQIGTFLHQGAFISGMPGSESALDLVPGSTLGRFAPLLASQDGARYAVRVRHKTAAGLPQTSLEIDSQGQVRSYVGTPQLTAAQVSAGVNFGAPAFVVQQDLEPSGYEVGFLARNNGGGVTHLGVASIGDVRTVSNPTGVLAFVFDNSVPPYNLDLATVLDADDQLNTTLTFLEIITPAAQAGVYLIGLRQAGTGRLNLRTLGSFALSPALPGAGAGTCRLLAGATLGHRYHYVGTPLDPTDPVAGPASAIIQGPGEGGGAALVLGAGRAAGQQHYLIRGVSSVGGVQSEVFGVTGAGRVSAASGITAMTGNITAMTGNVSAAAGDVVATSGNHLALAGEFTYFPARPKTIPIGIWSFQFQQSLNYLTSPLQNSIEIGSDFGAAGALVKWSLDPYLKSGMVLRDFTVVVDPGVARAAGNRIRVRLYSVDVDFGVPAIPVATQLGFDAFDNAGPLIQAISLPAPIAHPVMRDGAAGLSYFLEVKFGHDASINPDLIYGIQLHVDDSGPRNV